MAANYTSTGADTFPAGVVRSFAVARALSNIVLTTTYQDVGSMTITVTPKTTSSKFWVAALMHVYLSSDSSDSWQTVWSQIVVTPSGGSSSIIVDDEDFGTDSYGWGAQNGAAGSRMMQHNLDILHSPSSTTAQTYKLRAKERETAGTLTLNRFNAGWITVTEIG